MKMKFYKKAQNWEWIVGAILILATLLFILVAIGVLNNPLNFLGNMLT